MSLPTNQQSRTAFLPANAMPETAFLPSAVSGSYLLRPYAGAEHPKRITPATLFRLGYDTMEIAHKLNIPEPLVLKAITVERSRRLGLASPYAAKGAE